MVAAYKAEIDRLEALKLAALPALLQKARAVLRPLWQARASSSSPSPSAPSSASSLLPTPRHSTHPSPPRPTHCWGSHHRRVPSSAPALAPTPSPPHPHLYPTPTSTLLLPLRRRSCT